MALHGTAHHVETLVRQYRPCEGSGRTLDREAAQQDSRRFNYWFESDGSFVFSGRLPALAGAALINALEAAMEALPPSDIDPEYSDAPVNRPMRPRRRFSPDGGEPSCTRDRRMSHTAERYQVVVHVDAETLRDSTAGRCEIEHGPSLPAETARRLACDASLITVTENERGEPLDVGRKTRSIPPAIRRALKSRDSGCRFPRMHTSTLCRCPSRQALGARRRNQTRQSRNPVPIPSSLCARREHHRSNSARRHLALPDAGRQRVRRRWLDAGPGLCVDRSIGDARRARDTETAATRWRGERMDYGLAIQGLLQQADPWLFANPSQYNRFSAKLPAETSGREQEIEHDAEWHRCNEEGSFFMTEIKKSIRALGYFPRKPVAAKQAISVGKIPRYRNGNGALDGLAVFGCRKHALPFHGIQASLIQAVETGAGLNRCRDDPAHQRPRSPAPHIVPISLARTDASG